MTKPQYTEAILRMHEHSVGLLGTPALPSALAIFIQDFIEVQKDDVANSDTDSEFQEKRRNIRAIISFEALIRQYEIEQIKKLKEQADGKNDGY